jgi:small-conductance mechanosensitive channel
MPVPAQWFNALTPGRAWVMAVGIVILAIVVGGFRQLGKRRVPDEENRERVTRFFITAGVILALLWTAAILFKNPGQFTLAFGAIGAGVAFAVQEVIASVAGWLTILLAQFYRIGDRVELGGIKGDVIEIGLLRTRLMEIGQWIGADLYNGRTVLVANSFIFKQPVFNYSGSFPYIWDEIHIPFRYDTEALLAEEMLQRVVGEVTHEYTQKAQEAWEHMLEKYRIPHARMIPLVTMVATDNWMAFTARYPVDYRARRTTQHEIFTRILQEVTASNGKLALGSSTSQIIQPSSIDVIISRKPAQKS